jgi:hypothetical protein
MLASFLFSLGALSLLIAYVLYGLATRRGLVAPNRASWMIWSATTTTEALTYNALNEGALQNFVFFMSSIACIGVTISVWRHSKWARPTTLESICMAASTAALIIWLGYQSAFWAHVLVLLVVPISFLPTLAAVRLDPSQEQSPAWGLWTVSDLAMLGFVMTATKGHGSDLPYLIIELACHATIWVMIGFTSINPFTAFTIVGRKIMMTTVDPQSKTTFLLGRTHIGKAVFAGQAFRTGQEIIRFKGPILARRDVPRTLHDASDRYVQIGPNAFMGPSDGVDDLINHSCDPNSGLCFTGDGPVLVALRNIAFGEELGWDYSTTILDENWSMPCQCGAHNCRRTILDFHALDTDLKARYRAWGILPDYILNAPPRQT